MNSCKINIHINASIKYVVYNTDDPYEIIDNFDINVEDIYGKRVIELEDLVNIYVKTCVLNLEVKTFIDKIVNNRYKEICLYTDKESINKFLDAIMFTFCFSMKNALL